MTRDEAISKIVNEVVAFCDLTSASESRLAAMAGHYYDMAAGFTGFSILPDSLLSFVTTAVIRAWQRRGAEAVSSFAGISVHETYIDIEQDLKKQLRKMRCPSSPVFIPEPESEPDPEDENA